VTTQTAVRATTVNAWMNEAAAAVRDQRDYLTQLDSAIGDGDHGTNMNRGFEAVEKALAGQNGSVPPGRLLILAGKTLVSTVGGASGPLWGSALRRAGKALGDAETFAAAELVDALQAALDGIVELGAAEPGDKTIVDALGPAVAALRAGVEESKPLAAALTDARAAAEEGMHATVPMQARKGRASYLGERSVGHQDPGATSTTLIVAALERSVAEES
jgi:phosphoenolpyruvate---glycerone phosphotransferase subunit DhaL